jgi:hypothetical protein
VERLWSLPGSFGLLVVELDVVHHGWVKLDAVVENQRIAVRTTVPEALLMAVPSKSARDAVPTFVWLEVLKAKSVIRKYTGLVSVV